MYDKYIFTIKKNLLVNIWMNNVHWYLLAVLLLPDRNTLLSLLQIYGFLTISIIFFERDLFIFHSILM